MGAKDGGPGTPGPGGCAGPGRAWERGPRTRNAGLRSRGGGGGGRSLPRLDSLGCRSPCACAAPWGEEGGKKTSCPRVCMRGGCPDPMSRWWWGATGGECDPRPRHPLVGPGSARSSPGHLPGAAQGPRRAGGQEEAPKGWTPGAAARPALWEGARLCAAGSRVGVLPLPVLRPPPFGDWVSSLNPK